MYNQDLIKAIKDLNQELDDKQYSLVLNVLTEYGANITDEGFPYVAKIVSQVTDLLYRCRQQIK